jgi:hypothetical protein
LTNLRAIDPAEDAFVCGVTRGSPRAAYSQCVDNEVELEIRRNGGKVALTVVVRQFSRNHDSGVEVYDSFVDPIVVVIGRKVGAV